MRRSSSLTSRWTVPGVNQATVPAASGVTSYPEVVSVCTAPWPPVTTYPRTGQVHMGSSAADAVGGGPVVDGEMRDGDPARQSTETAHHGRASKYLAISSRSHAPSATTTR